MSRKVPAQKFLRHFRLLLLFQWIFILSEHQWWGDSILVIRSGEGVFDFMIGILLEKVARAAHLFHFLTVIRRLLMPQLLKIIWITGIPTSQTILEKEGRSYLEGIREKTLSFLMLMVVYMAWLDSSHFLGFSLFWSCWIRANRSTILVRIKPFFE